MPAVAEGITLSPVGLGTQSATFLPIDTAVRLACAQHVPQLVLLYSLSTVSSSASSTCRKDPNVLYSMDRSSRRLPVDASQMQQAPRLSPASSLLPSGHHLRQAHKRVSFTELPCTVVSNAQTPCTGTDRGPDSAGAQLTLCSSLGSSVVLQCTHLM
jgi:hypothetical protein